MRKLFLKFGFILILLSTNVIFADNTYEGVLEIIYIDSVINPQKLFRLRFNNGSAKELIVGENFNYPPESLLKIRAKDFGGKLKVRKVLSYDKKFQLVGSTNNTNGNKKLLVVMATDSSFSESLIPYSVSEIEDMVFGSNLSLSDYISEASYSKLNLTGEVIQTISIPNLCQSDNLFAHQAEETVLAAAETKIPDISIYDYALIVVPNTSECLTDAAGIGTLGRVSYNSQQGVIPLGINFVRAYDYDGYENAMLGTALHEFGHNLGLNHGNVNSCGEEIFSAEACPGVEYGDGHGIMGTTPNLAHYNMIQKEDLGWLSSSDILTIDNDSLTKNITLLPVSSSQSGIKMIKIRRDDGRYYSVEYRQALGYDGVKERSFESTNFGGFLVYLDEETVGNRPLMIDSQFEDFRASSELQSGYGHSYYVNFDITDLMHDRGLFSLNESFEDTSSDIVVTAQNLSSSSATITVNRGSIEDNGEDEPEDEDEDDAEDEEDDEPTIPDDDSTDNFLNASFLNPKTFNSNISLDFKKKTKVLLVIPGDRTKASDFSRYSVVKSSASKKITKIKKNRFELIDGKTVVIKLAPEKAFIKKGIRPDSNGEYTISVVVKERGKFASSAPVTLSFKVKSSNI